MITLAEIPVLRTYDHNGNLLEEVRREVTLSSEAKEAIARYIYKKIIQEREREAEQLKRQNTLYYEAVEKEERRRNP